MSNETYEIRLRKEFELLQKLQRHPSVNNDIIKITIQYKDRLRGGDYKSVLENPSSGLYPNSFRVTYKMPVYVGPGQLKRDWQASFLFSTPENILMNPSSKLGVEIEGGNFPSGSVPYNNHVSMGWVCTGTAWAVANQGFGIWYFIINLGCLFNMDRFMMVANEEEDPVYGVHHLNYDAYLYWKNERNMQPTNKINWPFKLMDIPTFSSTGSSASSPQKPKFVFGTAQKTEQPKPTFTFGPKK